MTEEKEAEAKGTARGRQFLPKLLEKQVTITFMGGGRMKATLVAYNPYELLLKGPGKKRILVYKHAVQSIDYEE